jgi:alanine-alpha-ketoisovalerate/valine-pyruvate aminotransferase
MFQRTGTNLDFINTENSDITSPVLTSMFNLSTIRKIGNISSTGGTTLTGNVFQNSAIQQVGNLDLPNAIELINFFYQTFYLHTIGTINAPLATNLSAMFTSCNALKEIIFVDCSNVNTVTTGSQGTFNLCYSLSRLIMPGMTIGFSIAGCNLTAEALNDLFISLGTANGAQTIIVTGNPGAATCDTTIATSKGFTVTV